MWVKYRHKIVFAILKPILTLYFKIRYNLHIERFKGKGPYLILANHCMTMDPFFIGGIVREPVYYMASEDLFNKGFISKIIRFLVAPIPKSKSMRDSQAIRDCLKVRNEGGTICIFPEGNRTYSGKLCFIDSSIGKLAKKLGMTILLVNIIGGFQTDPRFSDNIRKGKMLCKVKKVISKEMLEVLTVDELYNEIKENLNVPLVENIRFKSKKKGMYLERVMYYCADCGSYQTLVSNHNKISCTKCGYTLKYNDYAKFELIKGQYKPDKLEEYYNYQEKILSNMNLEETLCLSYNDKEIKLYEVTRSQRRDLLYEGEISLNKGTLVFNNSQFEFKFTDIISATCLGKNKLNFYIDNKIYQIKGNKRFCALKYMHAYYHYMNIKKEGKEDVNSEFLGL